MRQITTPLTSIIKTIKVRSSIKNPISIAKNSTINEIDSDSKVGGVKLWANSQAKLIKSTLLIEPSPGVGFLTIKVRLMFTKLRQAIIKALILYYFHSECHIWVKIDVFGYAINRILSQLTFNNLGQ